MVVLRVFLVFFWRYGFYFRFWTVFATLHTVQLVPFFKQVADRWHLALISKQSEICRLDPSKGISSYFHITKPQSCLFDKDKVWKQSLFYRILRKYKSGNVSLRSPRTPFSTEKKNLGPEYTEMQSFIKHYHTMNVFVELETSVFGLQMSYLLHF